MAKRRRCTVSWNERVFTTRRKARPLHRAIAPARDTTGTAHQRYTLALEADPSLAKLEHDESRNRPEPPPRSR